MTVGFEYTVLLAHLLILLCLLVHLFLYCLMLLSAAVGESAVAVSVADVMEMVSATVSTPVDASTVNGPLLLLP